MDRTPPSPSSEEIDLYVRTYYSLLRSTGKVSVRSLVETHAGMKSSLHVHAADPAIDLGAFIYAYLRLPPCMPQTRLVVLGQSPEVFARRGYSDVRGWTTVEAPGRRRKTYFDGKGTLAAQIASVSDIDDLVPMLVALQIEWNKIAARLTDTPTVRDLRAVGKGKATWTSEVRSVVASALGLSDPDFGRLEAMWGAALPARLLEIADNPLDLSIQLLAGSFNDYKRASEAWWRTIETHIRDTDILERPVYFVSSNVHSLVNLLTGFALRHQEPVAAYLERCNPEGLWPEYQQLLTAEPRGGIENLLYYALRLYAKTEEGKQLRSLQREAELQGGIHHVTVPHYLDIDAQAFELRRLDPERFDPRLRLPDMHRLSGSDAIIFNVDYPLGMGAYIILTQASTNLGEIRGVYTMGKAATLSGRIGDVLMPNVIYDEHSQNTFLFKNCFSANDVAPYLLHGTVFDNQKGVTVRGTFLQNRQFIHVFYKEGYTDIEMEAGPYLGAIYENIYPKRYPVNEIVNLFINAWFDIGVMHYASDTPYSRRLELLSKSLSYHGVDSTYACAVAILRRILACEIARQGGGSRG